MQETIKIRIQNNKESLFGSKESLSANFRTF